MDRLLRFVRYLRLVVVLDDWTADVARWRGVAWAVRSSRSAEPARESGETTLWCQCGGIGSAGLLVDESLTTVLTAPALRAGSGRRRRQVWPETPRRLVLAAEDIRRLVEAAGARRDPCVWQAISREHN